MPVRRRRLRDLAKTQLPAVLLPRPATSVSSTLQLCVFQTRSQRTFPACDSGRIREGTIRNAEKVLSIANPINGHPSEKVICVTLSGLAGLGSDCEESGGREGLQPGLRRRKLIGWSSDLIGALRRSGSSDRKRFQLAEVSKKHGECCYAKQIQFPTKSKAAFDLGERCEVIKPDAIGIRIPHTAKEIGIHYEKYCKFRSGIGAN